MKTSRSITTLLLAVSTGACGPATQSAGEPTEPTTAALAMSAAVRQLEAAGQFTQTAVTSKEVRSEDGNQIIEQTSKGVITGTLSGPFEDRLQVVIRPDGRITANFTITCNCTIDGQQGVVEMVAEDTGELVGQDRATFAGQVVIDGGHDDLSGLRGLLRIEGSVDVASGLSTYAYEGTVGFTQ